MRRKPTFLAAFALTALLGFTGFAGLVESSYEALGEGAQKALSATLSVSAGVVNWLDEAREVEVLCPRTLPAA